LYTYNYKTDIKVTQTGARNHVLLTVFDSFKGKF